MSSRRDRDLGCVRKRLARMSRFTKTDRDPPLFDRRRLPVKLKLQADLHDVVRPLKTVTLPLFVKT
nr:hypothetical protein [Fischerella sp. PCC 9605]